MVLVQSLVIGSLYALIAIGFTLIFGVGGVFNLAHGAFITIGAYIAWLIVNARGFSPWLGLLGGAVGTALLAGTLYYTVVRRIQEERTTVIVLTLIIAFMVIFLLFKIAPLDFVLPSLVGGTLQIGDSYIQRNIALVFVLSWSIIIPLYAFINLTRTGKAIQAVSMNERGSIIVGIDPVRINLVTWILAGALAGAAGVFISMQYGGGIDMGWTPMVISFAIVILGGLGSIKGSVIGAYVLSTVEVLTIQVSPQLTGVSSLVILIIVLVVKPNGLFGRGVDA